MNVLVQIHTYNDQDVIEESLAAVMAQSHPVPEILVVDNGSTDATLERAFPDRVTLHRHGENLGTSGAVRTGLCYAQSKGYDWLWILDADSAPEPDALRRLVEHYDGLEAEEQDRVWLLASLTLDVGGNAPGLAMLFAEGRLQPVKVQPGELVVRCDGTIWSGSMYRLEAVRRVGLPPADYVLDYGEFAYGYQGRQRGFIATQHHGSIVRHNLRGASLRRQEKRIGPFVRESLDLPAIRCYYLLRNHLYFWLYCYESRVSLRFLLHVPWWLLSGLCVSPRSHGPEIRASLRGITAGLLGRVHARY